MQFPLFYTPISLTFLYFVWYSFLGWCMESTFCSICQKRLINRGFLHLPLCPIYGVGVLIMVNFFTPFVDDILLFYLMATVVMSAWEYFVGWLLEVTTHVKYWDYSHRRFNLKGRICLGNSLYWGIAAYLAIFFIHPATAHLFAKLSPLPRQILALVLGVMMLVDTIITIRDLALLSSALTKVENIRVQLELGKMELQQHIEDHIEERKAALGQSISDLQSAGGRAKEMLNQAAQERARSAQEKARAAQEKARAAQEKLRAQHMAELARRSARFMKHYSAMSLHHDPTLLKDLRQWIESHKEK